MSITSKKKINFSDIQGKVKAFRLDGNPGINKREDARIFVSQGLTEIQFPDENLLVHISLGYLERLLLKLCAEIKSNIDGFTIIEYREGCGFFVGELKFNEIDEKSTSKNIIFHWEGSGEIEATWNSFIKWEVC